MLKWRFSLTKLLDILPYLTRCSMILLRHSALSALDLDANHGAGRCTHTFTPNTWPSFVGKYSSTMVRIWISRTVGSIFGDAQTIIGWLKHDGRDWLLKLKSQLEEDLGSLKIKGSQSPIHLPNYWNIFDGTVIFKSQKKHRTKDLSWGHTLNGK